MACKISTFAKTGQQPCTECGGTGWKKTKKWLFFPNIEACGRCIGVMERTADGLWLDPDQCTHPLQNLRDAVDHWAIFRMCQTCGYRNTYCELCSGCGKSLLWNCTEETFGMLNQSNEWVSRKELLKHHGLIDG